MKTKILVVLVVAIVFAACSRSSRHHSEKVFEADSAQVSTDSVVIPYVKELTMEEQFYAELFNKQELKFGPWKDSVIIETEGEGTYEYKVPSKVQHGSTKHFLFMFFASHKYWEEGGYEENALEIHYKLIGTPAEGKTLAEDAKNRELYEWNCMYSSLQDSIKPLLTNIQYPKERYVYKK